MSRFENEIVYFNGFKHITVNQAEHDCTLCKISSYRGCGESTSITCVTKFFNVILKTLNI